MFCWGHWDLFALRDVFLPRHEHEISLGDFRGVVRGCRIVQGLETEIKNTVDAIKDFSCNCDPSWLGSMHYSFSPTDEIVRFFSCVDTNADIRSSDTVALRMLLEDIEQYVSRNIQRTRVEIETQDQSIRAKFDEPAPLFLNMILNHVAVLFKANRRIGPATRQTGTGRCDGRYHHAYVRWLRFGFDMGSPVPAVALGRMFRRASHGWCHGLCGAAATPVFEDR